MISLRLTVIVGALLAYANSKTVYKRAGNGCSYKGNTYSEGQTWDDGCTYSCVCNDGNTGEWQCKAKCPSWGTLPPACTLSPPLPGNCCSYPKCPSGYTIKYPNGYKPEPGVSTGTEGGTGTGGTGGNTRAGCMYTDGTVHKVGETWSDGCKYHCTCKDAAGNYECRHRCLQWNLPSFCKMDPPIPGFCCGMPRCTWDVTFNFPPGYEKETGFFANGNRYIPDGTGDSDGGGNGGNGGTNGGNTGGCKYTDGSLHKHGETWKTGCSQSAMKCTCEDGATGRYTCNGLCPTWNSLPSSCMLFPPKRGKCCPTPQCPSGVTIQYPPGYVEE